MRLRVVWGLGVTIASFSPTMRFISVDLPTLGRPRIATVPAIAPALATALAGGPAAGPSLETAGAAGRGLGAAETRGLGAPATRGRDRFEPAVPRGRVRSFMGGLLIAHLSCYPEHMSSPAAVRGGLLVGLLALLGLGHPSRAAAPAATATTTPSAEARQLVSSPDGTLELRRGATVLLRLQLRTGALRRGTPRLRDVDVDGHPVVEIRVPIRGSASEEVWIGELASDARGGDARGGGGKPPTPIWSGITGARDADEEVGTEIEVSPERIVEYQTASQISRCDGATPRLFPRAWDFDSGRFRGVVSPLPPPAPQKLIARRGDPAMPAGRPIGGFHWTAASTTAAAGTDARNLTPPLAVDDGDPATAWTEGLGGDGRGEFLTARSTSAGYAVRGVRIIPGDASSAAAFRAKNRLRRFQLALGPAPDQRFDVEIPDDPAAAAHFAEPYWIVLPKPTPATCMTLVITEVTRGTEASPPRNFGTTAIADLAIFTDLDGPEGVGRLVDDIAAGPDCQQRVPLLVRVGEPAVMATAQSILGAQGMGRECLVEGLVALAPAPASPIVTDALAASLSGATDKEERLVTAALKAAPAPPIATLRQLLDGKTPKGETVTLPDRQRAARVLGALPQEEAATTLVAAAGRGPEGLRTTVVKALGDSPAVEPPLLLAALAQVGGGAGAGAGPASAPTRKTRRPPATPTWCARWSRRAADAPSTRRRCWPTCWPPCARRSAPRATSRCARAPSWRWATCACPRAPATWCRCARPPTSRRCAISRRASWRRSAGPTASRRCARRWPTAIRACAKRRRWGSGVCRIAGQVRR